MKRVSLRKFGKCLSRWLSQVVMIIHSLKEGVFSLKVRHMKRGDKECGLCGIWKDERPAVEIIKESR